MSPISRSAPGHAVNTVADFIKNGIRTGRFTPGQRLIASDLVADLQVSLGVVREALSLLDGTGLVEVLPNRGAQIRPLSGRDIQHIFELREALEGQAAALAARNVSSPQARQILLDVFRNVDEAAAAGDAVQYRSTNAAFHQTILRLSGNPRLSEIASELTVPIYRLQLSTLLEAPDLATAASGHRRIVDAILGGQQTLARDEMQEHVRLSGLVMMRLADG